MARQFVIVGNDYSGLGWAYMLANEGEEVVYAYEWEEDENDPKPDDYERFMTNGDGICDKLPLDQAMKEFTSDDTYWIFDSNHCSDESEELRKSGAHVFGASQLSATMEHDRAAAMKAAYDGGLDLADMIECKTVEEGIKFLESNDETAYVFKPNDSQLNWMTFVPTHEDPKIANEMLRTFLQNLHESVDKGFVLQERKKGVEVNFELWLMEGVPVLATCGLECKRLLNGDLGEHCGCSQDIIWRVPMECEGIAQTVGKLLAPYEKANYTGFVDANVIIADDGVWFLENCNRFGYSAHPNFFQTISLKPFGELMADWMNGGFDEDMFRKGFGASVNLSIEHPRPGWPMLLSDKAASNYYPYDVYTSNDKYLLAGFSKDVGLVTAHGYTIQDAAESCYETLRRKRAWFPDLGYRTDLAGRDYPSSPSKRYEALTAMGLL